jgi:hypothetical protein
MGPKRIDGRVRDALRMAGDQLLRYVRDTGRYPNVETWMDDVEQHCMVLGAFDLSNVLGDDYGLALNSELSDLPLDGAPHSRLHTVGLFISPDASRNASGDPDVVLATTDEGIEGSCVWLFMEGIVTAPHGWSAEEITRSVEDGRISRLHVESLTRALLNYARANGGELPPAESWCDAIPLYMPIDQDPDEVFGCPAMPGLDCAWAINEDLAGKDVRTIRAPENRVLLLPAKAGERNEARAAPKILQDGRYLVPWSDGPRLAVTLGMLDGNTRTLCAGNHYP